MPFALSRTVVLGSGTAGCLSALKLRRDFPTMTVELVRSKKVPIIGVGESTTAGVPRFLHNQLGLDRGEFWRRVRPSWKLGIRFDWGDPDLSHFHYPFDVSLDGQHRALARSNAFYCLGDLTDSSLFRTLMDRGKSPCFLDLAAGHVVDERGGYHIENKAFVAYLESKIRELGVEIIDGDVADVRRRENGDIAELCLEDGRCIAGDFFVDCSGFASILLDKVLGEPFVSYGDRLFCDRAVIGRWTRTTEPIYPYTTCETMDHGWCWRIEFADEIARGYVFASAFCSDDEARAEFKRTNPYVEDERRIIRFRSGRHENFWVKNVAAIGNAAAFVEPLESTAIHNMAEQLRFLVWALRDSDGRPTDAMRRLENRRYRQLWDDTRDFITIHYKFNRWRDTPFWRHCRETIDLGGAAEAVAYYQEAGPSILVKSLLSPGSPFGYEGYYNLLLGQRVPTRYRGECSEEDRQTWNALRATNRERAAAALPMPDALDLIHSENWTWPEQGW